MSQANAVQTFGLTKRFGQDIALDQLDLALPAGGVLLLAGTNGAGKSTLLRTLINRERPTDGRCTVLGLDPQASGPAVRGQVGYVPETTAWGYPAVRVGRMLRHVASDYPGWDQAYAEEICRTLEVAPDRRLGSLSKGQRRCVQIVAALAHRPALLLLDELTDGLDPIIRDRVLQLFAGHVADTGCSAILSTHLVSEVERLADRVAVLRAGRLLHHGPTEDLMARFRRIDVDAPAGWSPPPALSSLLVRADRSIGRSPSLIVSDPGERAAGILAGSGAAVRQTQPLAVAEAVLTILQTDRPS